VYLTLFAVFLAMHNVLESPEAPVFRVLGLPLSAVTSTMLMLCILSATRPDVA
jgi:hypothetical protein